MATNPFDEKAATWDEDPAKRARARVVARAVTEAVPLGGGVRMLEYGAGTGLVSEELRDAVGPIALADSSQGMLEVLHAKAAAGAFGDARVLDLDLGRDPAPEARFDLVVTVMALHHIPDLVPVLDGFATVLEPGGHLCVVDLEAEDGSFHDDESFHGHDGFDRDELAALLEAAGFTHPSFSGCGSVERHGRDYDLFFAVAVRSGHRALGPSEPLTDRGR